MSKLFMLPALLGLVPEDAVSSVTCQILGRTSYAVNRDNATELTLTESTQLVTRTTTTLAFEDEDHAERLRMHLVSINKSMELPSDSVDSSEEEEEEEEDTKPKRGRKSKKTKAEEEDVDTSAYGEGGNVIITDEVVNYALPSRVVHVAEIVGRIAVAIEKSKSTKDQDNFGKLQGRLAKGTFGKLVAQAFPPAGAAMASLSADASKPEIVAASSISSDAEKARGYLNRYYNLLEKYIKVGDTEVVYTFAALNDMIDAGKFPVKSLRELLSNATKESLIAA